MPCLVAFLLIPERYLDIEEANRILKKPEPVKPKREQYMGGTGGMD